MVTHSGTFVLLVPLLFLVVVLIAPTKLTQISQSSLYFVRVVSRAPQTTHANDAIKNVAA